MRANKVYNKKKNFTIVLLHVSITISPKKSIFGMFFRYSTTTTIPFRWSTVRFLCIAPSNSTANDIKTMSWPSGCFWQRLCPLFAFFFQARWNWPRLSRATGPRCRPQCTPYNFRPTNVFITLILSFSASSCVVDAFCQAKMCILSIFQFAAFFDDLMAQRQRLGNVSRCICTSNCIQILILHVIMDFSTWGSSAFLARFIFILAILAMGS